jgi:hypothetical protein
MTTLPLGSITATEIVALMNVEPNILFAVHEGAPFVGHDGNDPNLLLKGRPLNNAISLTDEIALSVLISS